MQSRVINALVGFCKEHTAVGIPCLIAMLFNIDTIREVFPIAGTPTIRIRSDFCHPNVIASKAFIPDDIYVISLF
jgi:hypothetical protein